MTKQEGSPLSGYRVLDLTEGGCMIAGKLMGDVGADVIKIERPGGAPSRNIGPFYKDIPHPERSLFWLPTSAFFITVRASVSLASFSRFRILPGLP